jgi:uncharacterized metal-binding protein
MSAGCVHTKGSVILAAGFAVGSLAFGSGVEYAIGALAGIPLSPDLDVDNGFFMDRIIRERLGAGAEKVWDAFWYPYRASLKHGGPLSHFPVIGTIGRLAYLYFFLLVVPYVAASVLYPGAWDIGYELRWWMDQISGHWKVIIGLMGSDFIHWGLDVMTKESANANNQNKVRCRPLRLPTNFRSARA